MLYTKKVKVYHICWLKYFIKLELGENPKLSRSRKRELMQNVTERLGRRKDVELEPEYLPTSKNTLYGV